MVTKKKTQSSRRMIDLNLVLKVALPLILLIAGGIWYYVTHTPEAMIKRQLKALSEIVSKHSGEGNASTAYKLLAFENMLDDNVDCDLKDFPYNGVNSGNALASLVFRGRSMLDDVSLSLVDAECEIVSKDEARARCAGHVRLHHGGSVYSESRNCVVLFRKNGKSWRITGFRDDQLLKK